MKTTLQRWGGGTVPVTTLVVVLLVLASGSAQWLYNLTIVATYALAVVGLNVLVGYAGQVSFAQPAFMAVGGYSVAILSVDHGMCPWLGLLIGIVLSVVAAVLIGLPLLRLRGHYLTMATFAVAMGTFAFVNADTSLTGGAIGLSAVPPLRIGSLSATSPRVALVGAWIVLLVAILIGVVLRRSHVGRAWRAIAAREEVAASLGIRVNRYKIVAFVIAAIFAAISGALYVDFTSFVSPDLFDATIAVNLFVMLFFGGNGKAFGPVVGAAFVIILPLQFSWLANIQGIIFDCVLLAVILLMPGGLLSRPTSAPVARWLAGRRQNDTEPDQPPLVAAEMPLAADRADQVGGRRA